MALIVADRVQETSTTTGTGNFTLGGAVTGFQAFSSVLATADTTYYTIADQGGANWEVGLGTFTSPSTLARTTILSSSNAGSAVNFTAGTKSVFVTYPAGRSVLRDANSNVSVNALFANTVATTASGTVVTLTAASAPAYVVSGSGGQTYQLPDATTLPVGAIYTFNNNQSSGTIIVRNNSATTVATVQSGAFLNIVLLANTPASGSWENHFYAPSNVAWSTNTLDYAGSITNATWNGNAIAASRGGTGLTTLTANNVLLGNGTGAVQFVAPSTSGNVLTSNGTTWSSTAPAVGPASYTRTAFTATAGQTTFTVSYVVGAVQVYVNGTLLNSADYTASNGTSVVLASACLSGDIVEFIAISGGTLALTTITVGTTALSGGSTGRVLYDNAGLVGEIAAGTSGNVLTSNGTSWTSATASPTNGYRRNRIINGGMQVDQRNAGASQTLTAAAALAYSVDRWYGYCTGANVTGQRVAGSSINQYRYQFSGAASVTAIGFGQRIEAANSYDLNNGTAIFSVDLANSLLTTVTWTAYYANTADTFGSLASPTRTQISTGTFTVTSTVTNYSASISVPSAATTGIEIVLTVGAQTSGTWTIGAVQLEAGSLATPFERLPIGETLALCQRYYNVASTVLVFITAWSTTPIMYSLQVTMRATPTVTLSGLSGGSGGAYAALSNSALFQSVGNSSQATGTLTISAEL